MTKEEIYELLQPFVFEAKKAKVEGEYDAFLQGLLEMEGYTDEEKEVIHKKFSKYKKKPSGKGWCFDFENCRWFRVRKLTPRECFRLMGVRDEDFDKVSAKEINPKNGKEQQVISNSQLYKMAGNSIVVDTMVEGIFKNLFTENEEEFRDTLF